jgi:Methionine synthase I, cobalamin-binding domain
MLHPFLKEECIPDRNVVLRSQGIPENHGFPEIEMLLEQAISVFEQLIKPVGIFLPVSKVEFQRILAGEGQNEDMLPLEKIVENGKSFQLFAFTMGKPVSQKIGELLKISDYPLAYMLDAVASRGVEKVAESATRIVLHKTADHADDRSLMYSPGYCGWHLTAQKKLFDALKPQAIGISLTEDALMQPIKSISGVIVTGSKEVHSFKNNFPFCRTCVSKNCRERIRNL